MSAGIFSHIMLALTLFGAGANGVGISDSASSRQAASVVDTYAFVVNNNDSTTRTDDAWKVIDATGMPTITNHAVAEANCFGCRAIAGSMQIVLVSNMGPNVTSDNGAAAINTHCDHCDSGAYAYQFVVASTKQITLSRDAAAQLRRLGQQFVATVRRGDSSMRESAELGAIADETLRVLRSGVQIVTPDAGRRRFSTDAARVVAPTSTTTLPSTTSTLSSTSTTAPTFAAKAASADDPAGPSTPGSASSGTDANGRRTTRPASPTTSTTLAGASVGTNSTSTTVQPGTARTSAPPSVVAASVNDARGFDIRVFRDEQTS